MARDEFDPEKYVCLARIGSFPVSGKGSGEVGIWRYGDGTPRIKIQRVGEKKGEERRRDAGGLTADEAEKVGPLLGKAAKRLREIEKEIEAEGEEEEGEEE